MDRLERQLSRIIFLYWRVPPREGQLLLRVLARSPASRAQILRNHLAVAEVRVPTVQGLRETDLTHIFATVLTPAFVMHLVEDLHAVGSLTRRQAARIEEAILHATSATGTWQAVE